MKKHNYSAGPCILPQEVFEQSAQAILDFNQSGLSSGGTIFLLRFPRPGPCGRPATIQATAPMPGTKMIITSHAHLGRARIEPSGVREQSIIEKIVSAVMIITAMTAKRSMELFYLAAIKEASDSAKP